MACKKRKKKSGSPVDCSEHAQPTVDHNQTKSAGSGTSVRPILDFSHLTSNSPSQILPGCGAAEINGCSFNAVQGS
ncbi:hypothetical protein BT96DRAFT_518312 [Gymnopus androsaceus JB14]|uniref:Uncharacterized protein n=1 Tax=Gymnopus androsaceus JB14 TaxID=1447944 RepID=A0A6A4HY59_9AGAR|nr:hypothetical protein BT96DRAFT_518312 [Gymnopus androsaceus JB14]